MSTVAQHHPSTLRLTRRGRLVVLLAGLAIALAVGIVLAGGSAATRPESGPTTEVVTVHTGDTLWDIAAPLAGRGDVQAVVDRIRELNDLDSGSLDAGQQLVVPLGSTS